MKLLVVIALCLWTQTEALRCWTCENVKTNVECNRKGSLRQCEENENACHNSVRRGPYGILITKRCKQDLACSNNEVQNTRLAWTPTQCNTRVPSSVCRCCCDTDACNADAFCRQENAVDCPSVTPPEFGRTKLCRFNNRINEIGSVCEFECFSGYRLVGSQYSQCRKVSRFSARFNNTAVRCEKEPICPVVNAPQHGTMNCTKERAPGSVCTFTCDGTSILQSKNQSSSSLRSAFDLQGKKEIACRNGKWSALSPVCVPVCPQLKLANDLEMECTHDNFEGSQCKFTCPNGNVPVGDSTITCRHGDSERADWSSSIPTCTEPICDNFPHIPTNGNMSCTDGRNVGSECSFKCNERYELEGSNATRCVRRGHRTLWDKESPSCKKKKTCANQTLSNGRIACTNGNNVGSVCSYQCTTPRYELFPSSSISAECLYNKTWNISKPCCPEPCTVDNSEVDLVIVVDSSSSIGQTNWPKVTSFVKSLISEFTVGENASRIGVFTYNSVVDVDSEIRLGDFPNNKRRLLQQFDKIPYEGSGTRTGNALRHARTVSFSPQSGNRRNVSDYLIVITDGNAQDNDILTYNARLLRNNNVHILAVGINPSSGRLNENQLRDLVENEEDMIIADKGFSDLNEKLLEKIVQTVCNPGC